MAELICSTVDRDAWLAARRQGITATDLPVILGLVQWDSPFCLYWRKKGKLPEVEQSDRMRLGSWLEDKIREQWEENTGHAAAFTERLWRSDTRPWQLATPDAVVMGRRPVEPFEPKHLISGLGPKTEQYPAAVLECKTSATRDGWGAGELPEPHDAEWERERSKVPAHVRAQLLWQMDTLGVATGHVAVVFLPSGEFRSYTIEHDTGGPAHDPADDGRCMICRDIAFMRDAAARFWYRLRDDDPPPVDGLQVTTDALRHLHAGAIKGKRAEIPDLLVMDYDAVCEHIAGLKIAKTEHENRIRLRMGDATLAVTADGRVIAWREVFKRAGYEVGPTEVDRLVRVKPKEDK